MPANEAAEHPEEPLLDGDDLQGDCLGGFRKNHQYFLFFQITDVPVFRVLLSRLVPQISTLHEVTAFNELYRLVRRRRGAHHTGLAALWTNIAFTHTGLRALTSDDEVDAFEDPAFTVGLAERAGSLGDVPPPGSDDPTHEWIFGGRDTPVDGVLVIAADDPDALERRAQEIEQSWTGPGGPTAKVWTGCGEVRRDLPGHEHFGFRDGISQPGVRGRLRENGAHVTPRYLKRADPRALRYARPGQRLVWPGEFVLGLPTQQLPPRPDLVPGSSRVPGPPWARNGSYLVLRRLVQDVAAFRDLVAAATAALLADGADVDSDRVAALLVGRWPSGAPLARAPLADDPILGADDFAANDFGYDNDEDGLRCPYSAHLRKINPRDQGTDLGGADNTLHRCVLRRGIPFGPPYTDATAAEERGLMFASYQASIFEQFEFLITDWVNSEESPHGDPGGVDLLIGGKPLDTRTLVISNPDGDPYRVPLAGLDLKPWVTATGGGYFFAPSLSTIAEVLAQPG